MRKLWCQDHKTWTWNKRKRGRDMARRFVLHAVPYIRKRLCSKNTLGTLQFGMPGFSSETRGDSMMVWAATPWYNILFVPSLPFMAELLQGSMWAGWVVMCIPWSRRYFRTKIHFSKTTLPLFTQLELFRHGLKSMKVNIFRAQHDHQISTSLNHSGEFSRLEWGTDSFPPPTSLKQLEEIVQGEYYRILVETVQNLYGSIPRRIAAVLKA
jgi:hypothetical protein